MIVVGFFLPWVGNVLTGWDYVQHGEGFSRLLFALCPILGASLAFAGFTNSDKAGRIAILSGGSIIAYTAFKVASIFVEVTGVGLWAVLGASLLALGLGVTRSK